MGPKSKVFRPIKAPRLTFPAPAPGFLAFGWAYRHSAVALSKGFDTTTIAAPLVFLYRHALETYLKGILIEYSDDPGVTKGKVVGRVHGLVSHLPDLRDVARDVGHDVSPELEEYIKQMHDFDSSSQEWRYPELHGAARPTSGATSQFDVPHFVERSESAFDELDEIANQLSHRKWLQILVDEGIDPYDQGEEPDAEGGEPNF
jgi:hypothetical protein